MIMMMILDWRRKIISEWARQVWPRSRIIRNETRRHRNDMKLMTTLFCPSSRPVGLGLSLARTMFPPAIGKGTQRTDFGQRLTNEHTRYNGYCMHAWYIRTGDMARHGWERYPLHIWFFCFWFFSFSFLHWAWASGCPVLTWNHRRPFRMAGVPRTGRHGHTYFWA